MTKVRPFSEMSNEQLTAPEKEQLILSLNERGFSFREIKAMAHVGSDRITAVLKGHHTLGKSGR